jgi:tripartite-type tricarboxylate transporter receptor subunit TctC
MRTFNLAHAALITATLLLTSHTLADDYPSRPITILVGASPGGTTETMAGAALCASTYTRR